MARTPLDALLTEKVLHCMSISRNAVIMDMIADDQVEHNVPLKNVCAKVHPSLSERIDNICNFLDISKRQFLEAAFVEACNKASAIMEAEGLHEYLAEEAEEAEARARARAEAKESAK